MDTGSTHSSASWCMRLGENAVRSAVMALVLTGQMLPAGSVSAQDDPLPPSAVASEQPPAPPASTAVVPTAAPVSEEKLPAAAQGEKAAAEAAQAVSEAISAAPLPTVSPVDAPGEIMVQEGTHRFGDWIITIRPGVASVKPAPFIQAPIEPAPAPQTSVSVPVTVHVHNHAAPYPWMWSVPSTYPTGWYAPTSAYLFQRPRPYWQLRGDFHHLGPFIPGLWY